MSDGDTGGRITSNQKNIDCVRSASMKDTATEGPTDGCLRSTEEDQSACTTNIGSCAEKCLSLQIRNHDIVPGSELQSPTMPTLISSKSKISILQKKKMQPIREAGSCDFDDTSINGSVNADKTSYEIVKDNSMNGERGVEDEINSVIGETIVEEDNSLKKDTYVENITLREESDV